MPRGMPSLSLGRYDRLETRNRGRIWGFQVKTATPYRVVSWEGHDGYGLTRCPMFYATPITPTPYMAPGLDSLFCASSRAGKSPTYQLKPDRCLLYWLLSMTTWPPDYSSPLSLSLAPERTNERTNEFPGPALLYSGCPFRPSLALMGSSGRRSAVSGNRSRIKIKN